MDSKFFTLKEISGGTFRITGLGGENCYLVEGNEKALLIDALAGAGNLKAFCRELTDLPLTLINTHGHVDHGGGNFDFEECFIQPDDIALLYEHCLRKNRMNYVHRGLQKSKKNVNITENDFTEPKPIKTFPVYDGAILGLGGRDIEIIGIPGHTQGSIVLLDKKNRILFSGDACNANTLLFLPHSTTIETYKKSLGHFKTFQPYFDVMYGGHGLDAIPKTIIDEAIELCVDIINGTDDAVFTEYHNRPCYYGKKKTDDFKRLDGKIANIAYSKEKIFDTIATG